MPMPCLHKPMDHFSVSYVNMHGNLKVCLNNTINSGEVVRFTDEKYLNNSSAKRFWIIYLFTEIKFKSSFLV